MAEVCEFINISRHGDASRSIAARSSIEARNLQAKQVATQGAQSVAANNNKKLRKINHLLAKNSLDLVLHDLIWRFASVGANQNVQLFCSATTYS